MESAPESAAPSRADVLIGALPGVAGPERSPRVRPRRLALLRRLEGIRYAFVVYGISRLILVATVYVNAARTGHSVGHELTNWDGAWYQFLALHGYPTYAYHAQSTLGFFPLYPMAVWVVSRPLLAISHHAYWSTAVAGITISGVGGLVTAVLVQRLATSWWGEQAGRRAVWLFSLFPGSVVFLMAYAEGIIVPLAAGCILALQQRRWLLAGVLAGLATACEPEALILVLVCAVSALAHLRRQGWRLRAARRSLLAPLLSLTGVGGFGVFLWAWTGTPFATLIAQHYGWHEKTDPVAVIHLFSWLIGQIHFGHFDSHPTINLNLVVGVAGVLLLIPALFMLWKSRREVSGEALLWTLGIVFLTVTSEFVPPNPRLLITAFPVVVVAGRYLGRRSYQALLVAFTGLLVVLSALTFVGPTVRP